MTSPLLQPGAAARSIPLAGTANVRDLGPLPTHDGGWVRPGRVYRGEALTGLGDDPGSLNPTEAAAFEQLGLRTIVDLRSDLEYDNRHSLWSAVSGATVLRVPIAEGGEGSATYLMGDIEAGRITEYSAEDLGTFYIEVLHRQAAAIGDVLHTWAQEDALPNLVHCANGKDRTGICVAVLLSLLGVPRELIVDDYVLSGVNAAGLIDRFADRIRAAGAEPEAVRVMFETPELAMHMVLDHLENDLGGTEQYLIEHVGLSRADLDALQRLHTTQEVLA
ncbi:tyrosine-protein phosphatase [Kribbia dieselivorans]|uniref:tyrosine-protein phosphatase n=1 Tax=Kribbia dieselivorans TaxID=331526 RepID=UPI000838CFF9|nr:tyrosine-protein phosphatase [Kribbia dieselivorans]